MQIHVVALLLVLGTWLCSAPVVVRVQDRQRRQAGGRGDAGDGNETDGEAGGQGGVTGGVVGAGSNAGTEGEAVVLEDVIDGAVGEAVGLENVTGNGSEAEEGAVRLENVTGEVEDIPALPSNLAADPTTFPPPTSAPQGLTDNITLSSLETTTAAFTNTMDTTTATTTTSLPPPTTTPASTTTTTSPTISTTPSPSPPSTASNSTLPPPPNIVTIATTSSVYSVGNLIYRLVFVVILKSVLVVKSYTLDLSLSLFSQYICSTGVLYSICRVNIQQLKSHPCQSKMTIFTISQYKYQHLQLNPFLCNPFITERILFGSVISVIFH